MEQIYEYCSIVIVNDYYELEENIEKTLNVNAKEGWQFKSLIDKGDKVIIIFERYHPDYKRYNDELMQYIKEAK